VIADDELISRLSAFASAPVDDDLAAHHEALMGMVAQAPVRHRTRALVAGGTLVAAMFAGTGIAAAAGNLPGPAQKIAHSALAKIGVDVPKERSTEGCNGKEYKNHGQFMKDQPKTGEARSAAAKSKCGKPINDDDATTDEDEANANAQNEDHGKATAPGQTGEAGKSGEDHGKAPDTAGQPDEPGKPDTTPPVDTPAPDDAANDAGQSNGKGKAGR
jgi:hypothetical protein